MSTESQQPRRPTGPRKRLQFRVRTLLGAAVVIAMLFAVAYMVGPSFAGTLVVWAIFAAFYLRLRAYAPLVALCIGPAIGIVPSSLIIFFWWPLAGFRELGPDTEELVCWPLWWAVVLSVVVGFASAVQRRIASRAGRSGDQSAATDSVGPHQICTWSPLKWAIMLALVHTVPCIALGLLFSAWEAISPDPYLAMLFLGAMAALDLPIVTIPLLHESSPFLLITLELVLFGGVLYAAVGWLIGYLLDRVHTRGVAVLWWCVGISAAAVALAGVLQEKRFEAVRQRQAALDAPVAAESEKAVLQTLRNLNERHDIIRRYGQFEALQGEGHHRVYGAFGGLYGLGMPRVLQFEKAEARVKIMVYRAAAAGDGGDDDDYDDDLPVQIEMRPPWEFLEQHPELRLEIVGSEIEFVGPDMRVRSTIEIKVDHPGFRGD